MVCSTRSATEIPFPAITASDPTSRSVAPDREFSPTCNGGVVGVWFVVTAREPHSTASFGFYYPSARQAYR